MNLHALLSIEEELQGKWPKNTLNGFWDKDYKPKAPSPASSVLKWLAGEVKEPTRLS